MSSTATFSKIIVSLVEEGIRALVQQEAMSTSRIEIGADDVALIVGSVDDRLCALCRTDENAKKRRPGVAGRL